ncbi:MAG: hypothetical protein WHS87_10390 [Anaerolineales bacterium]
MDPQLLQQLTTFLAPFLPYLLKMGEKAAEEAGKRLGEAAWEQAKALWEKLRRKENVEQVAQTAAALPDNAALLDALRTEMACLSRRPIKTWLSVIALTSSNR